MVHAATVAPEAVNCTCNLMFSYKFHDRRVTLDDFVEKVRKYCAVIIIIIKCAIWILCVYCGP